MRSLFSTEHPKAQNEVRVLFVCSGYTSLSTLSVISHIICHITTVSGCDRELNAHFYSAASLWYQIPDTFT